LSKLIPPIIANYRFEGERDIALKLQNDPATSDWIVLHSLDIAKHRSQVLGECDFVIIIPCKGVLCLEVKGCKSLKVDGGLWYYGTNPNADTRGPFKQASEAMHSIRNYLVEKRPDLRHIVFWSGVIFPFINFERISSEWHSWQVIDAASYMSRPIHQLFTNILDQARETLSQNPKFNRFNLSLKAPDIEQCRIIAETLRPEFEFYESPAARRKNLEKNLKKYTSEQFIALDAMHTNPRVIFNGPAGTGKTLLAIESARRAGLRGKKTLFLCFNKNISTWINSQFTETDRKQITVSTLHAFMLKVAKITAPSGDPDFWSFRLPESAIDIIIESNEEPEFDFLVIDEAQDILRKEYFDFIDLCLKGGLSDGQWKMFGDFVYQQIYSAATMRLDETIDSGMVTAPVYTLSINCRNTPRVAAYAPLLGGLAPDYSNILRPDDKIKPEMMFVRDAEAQTDLLSKQLERFRFKEKFRGEEIIILSPFAAASCAARLPPPWKDRIKPFSADGQGGAYTLSYNSCFQRT
jgi:DNA polymerase III delta prime subunit